MRLALAALALVISACGDDASISGVWSGRTADGVNFNLTLVETPQGAVSGAGRLTNGITAPLPVNATGAHAHPSISLTLDFPRTNYSPINFQGIFNGSMNVIRGALNGSGFDGDSLNLSRNTPPPSARITAP
ncbi:MAG: hypothetical protein HY700_12175 [Gemmatimonadetes bacterium]|nr:hypothetical protein [Gemmatimonadota bacterium]